MVIGKLGKHHTKRNDSPDKTNFVLEGNTKNLLGSAQTQNSGKITSENNDGEIQAGLPKFRSRGGVGLPNKENSLTEREVKQIGERLHSAYAHEQAAGFPILKMAHHAFKAIGGVFREHPNIEDVIVLTGKRKLKKMQLQELSLLVLVQVLSGQHLHYGNRSVGFLNSAD